MQIWQNLLRKSVTSVSQLPDFLSENSDIEDVVSRYPMRINPYYLGLIKSKGDPLWLQSVPTKSEL